MKLFLCSIFIPDVYIPELERLVGKPLKKTTASFIPTAADPYKDKWFVEADRKMLRKLGIQFIDVDLKQFDKNPMGLKQELNKRDIVFVSGGNSFYLNYWIKKVGFKPILQKLLMEGKVYIGGSAGAAIAGSSLKPLETLDDPSKAPARSNEGLGLVNYVILPHYGIEKYEDRYKKILEEFQSDAFVLKTLTNEQAIIVNS